MENAKPLLSTLWEPDTGQQHPSHLGAKSKSRKVKPVALLSTTQGKADVSPDIWRNRQDKSHLEGTGLQRAEAAGVHTQSRGSSRV